MYLQHKKITIININNTVHPRKQSTPPLASHEQAGQILQSLKCDFQQLLNTAVKRRLKCTNVPEILHFIFKVGKKTVVFKAIKTCPCLLAHPPSNMSCLGMFRNLAPMFPVFLFKTKPPSPSISHEKQTTTGGLSGKPKGTFYKHSSERREVLIRGEKKDKQRLHLPSRALAHTHRAHTSRSVHMDAQAYRNKLLFHWCFNLI